MRNKNDKILQSIGRMEPVRLCIAFRLNDV